ncbi:MAG: carboxypeptidase regulatory-like domain-containing protein [Prevotella sp.]|nr:carboxypeptidase regulatory-like domain-containing protein [Prevotella sp.]
MKKTDKSPILQRLAAVAIVLMATLAAAAQNTLRVADFTQAAGKEAYVPLYLDNSDDVVGLQFDITLPYAKSGSNAILIDERIEGHTLSLRKLSDTKYTVVVMSMQNRPLRGNGGLLIRFPISVPSDAQADDTKAVTLDNIVLTSRTGANVASQTTQTGTFTVLRTPTPDFVPTDLTIYNSDDALLPGGKLQLQFNVLNQGTGDSRDGWSEKIYLEDLTGTRSFIVAKKYPNTLPAGESMSRLYEVDIPQALHIDGTVHAVVEIVALKSTDELIADQGNNTATSANSKELEKRIFLSSSRILLKEGNRQQITLKRSGDWTASESFALTELNDHGVMMLSLPQTVTIPAKREGVSFYVTATNNDAVNTQYRTGIAATGDDYPETTMIVDVEDDDSFLLTLTTNKPFYSEGDDVVLTLSASQAVESDLNVTITNNDAGRFYPYVRSITIPAGQTQAQATTAVVDDGYPMNDATVTFTATATGFTTAKHTVGLQDNDWPTLKLTLSRNIISEDDGYAATMGTITRQGNTTENLTLYLNYQAKSVPADANNRELFFDSQYVIIPAGQQSVTFPISVEDNSTITTQRIWTITAAACDALKGKPVGSSHRSYTTADLTVTDNDSEGVLKLQCNTATLTEGGPEVTLTVSRNSSQGELTVSLSGDVDNLVTPQTVTIANGKTSATFKVKIAQSDDTEENYYARVTAAAASCQQAQFVFMVSTLPDAVCTLAQLDNAQPFGGQTVSAQLNVTNQGSSTLQPGMEVRFFLLDGPKYTWGTPSSKQMASYVCLATLSQAVPAGQTVTQTVQIELPSTGKMMQYYLMAWMNPLQTMAESNKNNNRSNTVPINLHPAFTLNSISTDKHTYTRGETILFTGQMSNAGSQLPMDGQQIDVYLTNDTKRYQTSATLDAQGNFTAEYTFGEQTGGRYKVGACVHGSGGTETGATINVARLQINRNSYLLQDIIEGVALEGDITLTNLSEEPLFNLTFRIDGLPDDWEVELTSIAKLEGGATGNCHYRVVATEPDFERKYSAGKANHKTMEGLFIASAQDSEGEQIADSEMPVYFKWYHADCNLVASDIKTTIYRDGSRQMYLLVENTGIKETGDITVEYSSGQQWLTVPTSQLATIASEGYTFLTLNLTGQQDMIIDGTYEATIRLTPQYGKKKDVKVKCTAVSTNIATLLVDVVDAYTLGTDDADGPHVSGASVRLTNALTGEVAMTGTTGADGIFRTDILKEGTYYVYVTAPNHYYAEKTITVEPGVENQLEVFLNYEAVKITYTVERTTVTDEYKTELLMDIVPDIPQAIVVPDLPENWGNGTHAFSVTLTNKGRLTAYTPYFEFPQVDGYSFKVIGEYPSVIYPNESFDVSVEYSGPETTLESKVGYIRMNYAYKMRGETYWSSETYMAMMGYGMIIMLPDGGLPNAGYDTEGKNFGRYIEPVPAFFMGGGGAVFGCDVDEGREPIINIRDYTQSVDNRVRLKFEQKFFLEREAFKGTLTIENLQMDGIENVVVVPSVKTLDGTDATDLFAISTTKVSGWSGDDDHWNLTSSATGLATVLYVPSKETAPTEPVDYLFGGTLTYRNVSDGKLVTCELTQTQLTVNPSPDLHLTYFVQRDFISDDPLTDEVEPWEPAQFALLIQNKGAGDAIDLKIETSDPMIVDNACNLPVQFTKLKCTVDGIDKDMDFNNLSLGKIPAGSSVMARWWFYSNVMAHVANYEARMTKHSNYGVEFDLITLDGVRELTRTVSGTINTGAAARRNTPGTLTDQEKQTGIMLLNLIADDQNLPDHVMDTEGNETDDLEIVSDNATVTAGANSGEYILTVRASRQGWVYGVTHDPTNCTMQLVRAVRLSDGKDVTANIWQTDRTVTANYSTIIDNRLHWADNITASTALSGFAAEESYTLYYEPKPAAAPVVKSIEPVIAEGSDISKATKVLVTMQEAVNTATIDDEDVALTVGNNTYDVTIEVLSPTTFTIDWSQNTLCSGPLSLSVFTSGISNLEGKTGSTNKNIQWTAVVKGDINGDGDITAQDASLVLQLVAKKIGQNTDGVVYEAADVNGDGDVTAQDASLILQYVARKITW